MVKQHGPDWTDRVENHGFGHKLVGARIKRSQISVSAMVVVFMSRSSNLSISSADVDAVGRLLRALQQTLPAHPTEREVGVVSSSQPAEAVKLARRLKGARNLRSNFFPDDLFGEPAWDLLLALYLAEGEGYRLRVSELCDESGVPATTALRWIEKIVSLGLAIKKRNPLDARSNFIEITSQGLNRMRECLLSMNKKLDQR